MFPHVLAVTMAFPSYVGCSSLKARFHLLGPTRDEVAPTNTGIWFLESVEAPEEGRPGLLDQETGDAIDAIELTTPLRNGLLVELRPSADLAPRHRYAIVIPGFEELPFTTDLDPDRIRPPIPRAMESDDTAPFAHCMQSASILIHTETSEMGDFLFATNTEDGDLAVARDEDLLVPAAHGEHLAFSVLAMDLAGNRSPPTAPIDASTGGCRTTASGDALFLSLLPIFLLAKRRRR